MLARTLRADGSPPPGRPLRPPPAPAASIPLNPAVARVDFPHGDPPKTLISPRFTPEKLDSPTLDDLIDIFEDRLSGWLLGPVNKLLGDPVDQVAGIGLSLSYFEGISIYLQGQDSNRKSKQFFRQGFVEVFRSSGTPTALLERVADVLYEDGRCGFFHDAMFRSRVYFGQQFEGPLAITLPKVGGVIDQNGEIQTIVVHGLKYFEYLQGHFATYVAHLRNPSQTTLRENFEAACKLKWDLGGPSRVIAL